MNHTARVRLLQSLVALALIVLLSILTALLVERDRRVGEEKFPEADLLTEQPAMRYDFRELHAQLIERHLGLDPAPVFPEPFQTTGELDVVV